MPETYQPSAVDVICGRGKPCFLHPGNVAFRAVIDKYLRRYDATITKLDKSRIVDDIVHKYFYDGDTHSSRFVRFCDEENLWYEIPYDLVRQKVGQTLRDTVTQQDPHKLARKKYRRALRNAIRYQCTTKANYIYDASVARTAFPSTQQQHVAVRSEHHQVSASIQETVVAQFQTEPIQTEDHDLCGPMSRSINAGSRMQKAWSDFPSDGRSLCSEVLLKNDVWWASPIVHAHKTLDETLSYTDDCCMPNEEDSDLASVSSCEWFRDCRDMSIGHGDWFDDDEI